MALPPVRRGLIDGWRTPNALVVLVACGCLLSSTYARPGASAKADSAHRLQRRALLQEDGFEVGA